MRPLAIVLWPLPVTVHRILGPSLLVPPSLRFAKGLLAEELRERGEGFIRFQSWSEMVDSLLNGSTGNR